MSGRKLLRKSAGACGSDLIGHINQLTNLIFPTEPDPLFREPTAAASPADLYQTLTAQRGQDMAHLQLRERDTFLAGSTQQAVAARPRTGRQQQPRRRTNRLASSEPGCSITGCGTARAG